MAGAQTTAPALLAVNQAQAVRGTFSKIAVAVCIQNLVTR